MKLDQLKVVLGDKKFAEWEKNVSDRILIEGSIAKWEKVVNEEADGSNWTDCPLCLIYFDGMCEGCPIAKATGEITCDNTPFEDYCDAISGNKDPLPAAKEELEFLKGLLECTTK